MKTKTTPRLELGTSDPITYTCTCPTPTPFNQVNPTQPKGQTLLFYRYFSKPPLLPLQHQSKISPSPSSPEIENLASYHRSLLTKWDLGGRIRVGVEGFNGTVAGSFEGVEGWMEEVCGHWSFDGLGLDAGDGGREEEEVRERREKFFKPSGGCKCVFGGEQSVMVKMEITPMGVSGYTPNPDSWSGLQELEPWEWHEAFSKNNDTANAEDRILLDVRNFYESRIGYFIDPTTGKEAIKPAIRRFSQWPLWVRERLTSTLNVNSQQEDKSEKREIFTYCTGGIRCEKGIRYMQSTLPPTTTTKVYTLKGGISAYLLWMDSEILAGRKKAEDSLFLGRNYVFDARGSIGLTTTTADPVSKCHGCEMLCDRLGKCRSGGCHLVLVVCEACELGDVRCCGSCGGMGGVGEKREICGCERERERGLWGEERVKKVKGQGWRKKEREMMGLGKVGELDIRVKTIGS